MEEVKYEFVGIALDCWILVWMIDVDEEISRE